MKKHLISILVLFLLLSTSFVGISNQKTQETVDADKSELPINSNCTPLLTNDTPGIQWVKYFGGSDNFDDAQQVRQTSDGGYILVGTTQTYTSDGYQDAWLIKTDKNGNEEWIQTYGEVGFINWTYGCSVQQTRDGGYAFVGNRIIYPGDYHTWLVKTTADGTEQWNKTYNSSVAGFCIQLTTGGGYIIAGRSSMGDAWLCQLSENGDILWEQTFFEADSTVGYYVQQTFDGGFIITGRLYYEQNDNESGFLVKTDANGHEQWNKTYEYLSPFSGFYSVQVLPDGYCVAGFIDQKSDNKVWLVRTDELGNMVWNRTYTFGTVDSPMSVDMTCTTDGGFILTGFNTAEIYYGWVLKTDSEGHEEWRLNPTVWYEQEFRSIQETTDGSYIIAGISYETEYPNAVLVKIGHVPQVTITKPISALYLFNIERRALRFPFIIGPITIEAEAYDTEYSIERVEFAVDGVLKYTDTTEPYSWRWTTPSFFTHTLTVTAYNSVGNCSKDTINVFKIF